MLFNSVTYLVFLTVAVLVFWALPMAARRFWLLAASLLFYCWWDWRYGFLIASSILLNYLFGLLAADRSRKWTVVVAVAANLGALIYFKYLDFLAGSLNGLSQLIFDRDLAAVPHIVLPIGISFFTFQGLSYVIDIARGQIEARRSLVTVALYITFWPHLIAGPIVRAGELIPQFYSDSRRVRYSDIASGLQLIFVGLFLKVFLADGISGYVDEGFAAGSFQRNSALDNWTLAFGFGWQIYFDFAGYSMIAQGSARLLGIVFPDNFNFPYAARSPREFWQRWHITLSSWIRDYLYVPMQGLIAGQSRSRGGIEIAVDERMKSNARHRIGALIATWMIMGLWHGANWTFLAWGVWHAGLILIYRGLSLMSDRIGIRERINADGLLFSLGGCLITMPAAMVGWLFFRAPTLEQAFSMVARLLDVRAYGYLTYKENFYLITFLYTVGFFVAYASGRMIERKPVWWGTWGWLPKSIAYTAIVMLSLGFLRSQQQFIYFQF